MAPAQPQKWDFTDREAIGNSSTSGRQWDMAFLSEFVGVQDPSHTPEHCAVPGRARLTAEPQPRNPWGGRGSCRAAAAQSLGRAGSCRAAAAQSLGEGEAPAEPQPHNPRGGEAPAEPQPHARQEPRPPNTKNQRILFASPVVRQGAERTTVENAGERLHNSTTRIDTRRSLEIVPDLRRLLA